MSRHKSSPFYDARHDPDVVKHIYSMVCRCRAHGKNPDVVLDTTRLMYVCKDCRKPWMQNENYTRICFGCDSLFVVWIFNKATINTDLCHDCGGSNAALPNMVTTDEIAEHENQVEKENANV